MKVCLISPLPPPLGGLSIWSQIVTSALDKTDNISFSHINTSTGKSSIEGRSFVDRFVCSGIRMLKCYLDLKKILINDPPDVVHMTTSGGFGYLRDILLLTLAQNRSVPAVYHIHFGRAVNYNKGDLYYRLLNKAVELSAYTVAIDNKTCMMLKERHDNVCCINNPIDVKKYSNVEPEENKSIVYLGAVIEPKGINELIEAFLVFNKYQDDKFSLLLVGPVKEAYRKTLKERYRLKNIYFTGRISHEEAMNTLAKCKVMVLPSYTEGFPNVVLEAMALKKMIIGTNVGAIPDMLSNECGIVIEPRNSKMIFEKLMYVCDERISKPDYGENAYRKVNMIYDIAPTMRKYRDLWEKVSTGIGNNDNGNCV